MSESTPSTREDRLAARLRENLRRRKAQARALNAPETGMAESECANSSPDGEADGGNAGLFKPVTGV